MFKGQQAYSLIAETHFMTFSSQLVNWDWDPSLITDKFGRLFNDSYIFHLISHLLTQSFFVSLVQSVDDPRCISYLLFPIVQIVMLVSSDKDLSYV